MQITITTKNCTVVEIIEIDRNKCDLSKSIAKAFLSSDIFDALYRAEIMEIEEEKSNEQKRA